MSDSAEQAEIIEQTLISNNYNLIRINDYFDRPFKTSEDGTTDPYEIIIDFQKNNLINGINIEQHFNINQRRGKNFIKSFLNIIERLENGIQKVLRLKFMHDSKHAHANVIIFQKDDGIVSIDVFDPNGGSHLGGKRNRHDEDPYLIFYDRLFSIIRDNIEIRTIFEDKNTLEYLNYYSDGFCSDWVNLYIILRKHLSVDEMKILFFDPTYRLSKRNIESVFGKKKDLPSHEGDAWWAMRTFTSLNGKKYENDLSEELFLMRPSFIHHIHKLYKEEFDSYEEIINLLFKDCDDKYIVIARKFLEISSFIEPEILQVEKPPLRRSSRYQHGYEDGLKYAMNQLNN